MGVAKKGEQAMKFILKFIGSMIKAQKGRMFIVLLGMTICSFFVLNFFYFCTVGSKTKEELCSEYFHATLQYTDADNIEAVTDILEKKEGITQIELMVWMDGKASEAVPTDIPEVIDETELYEEMILVAYAPYPELNNDQIDLGMGFDISETNKVMVTYAGAQEHGLASKPDSTIELCGRTYTVSGYYNNWGYDAILPVSELLSICREYEYAPIQIEYWYDETLDYNDILDINKELSAIKEADRCICEEPDIDISWEIVWQEGRVMFFSMIISVFNFMFVYKFMLKNRLQQYRTLKLLGVTSNKLQAIMLLEMILTYTISFGVAYLILCMYIKYRDLILWSMGEVWISSYLSMLAMIGIIFIVFTRGFSRKTPFASYQEG